MASMEFWFEYGSTYSYLSVARIGRMAQRAGVEVAWRPFLLTPILSALGMPKGPFLTNPAKMAYMWRDLERRAAGSGGPGVRSCSRRSCPRSACRKGRS